MPTLSCRLATRLVSHEYRATAPGQTVATLWNLEAPPLWVRLIYFNHSFDTRTVDAACIATSAALHDGLNPVGADGAEDSLRWRQVTFGAGGADSPPFAPVDPSKRSLTMLSNRNGTPARPGRSCSDWVRTDPIARADGGAGALLLTRSFSSRQFSCNSWHPASGLDKSIGRDLRSCVFDADLATEPGHAEPRGDAPLIAPFAVEYIAAAQGATVLGIGDSILSSLSTSGRISGPGLRACAALSTPQRPVSWLNEAYAARRSAHFHFNGIADILLHRPQVALIECWSANDDKTLAAAEAAFAGALLVADTAQRHGCTPVLLTAPPALRDQPDAEVFRAASNDWVRAAGERGFHVLDLDARWGTGAVPNVYRKPYGVDGVHPSDRACADLAELDLVPLLRRILDGEPSTCPDIAPVI